MMLNNIYGNFSSEIYSIDYQSSLTRIITFVML